MLYTLGGAVLLVLLDRLRQRKQSVACRAPLNRKRELAIRMALGARAVIFSRLCFQRAC